jgi:hypothetical protein
MNPMEMTGLMAMARPIARPVGVQVPLPLAAESFYSR